MAVIGHSGLGGAGEEGVAEEVVAAALEEERLRHSGTRGSNDKLHSPSRTEERD